LKYINQGIEKDVIVLYGNFIYRPSGFLIAVIIVQRDNDVDAIEWERIYRQESPILFGYLIKKIGPVAAQDILQESFLKLIEVMKKGRSIENMRAYLFQIARNILINEYKSKIISIPDFAYLNTADQFANLQENLEKKEIMEILESSRSVLSDKEIEIFEFRWYFGMKQNEISEILQKSERQIRRDLEKITQKIREYFKQRGWQAEHITGEL